MATEEKLKKSNGKDKPKTNNQASSGGGLVSQAKKNQDPEYKQYKYFLDEDIVYTDKKGSPLYINKELIKVIIIERDYENSNMPFIMLRGGVQDTTLLRIASGSPEGNMNIKISKAIPGFDSKDRGDYQSGEPANLQYINKQPYINDTFQVMMEDQSIRMYEKFASRVTNSNPVEDEIKDKTERNNEEPLNVGLIKKEHMTRIKAIINTIIPAGVSTTDVLAFFFSEGGFSNILLSKPDNPSNNKDLVIPPMSFLDALKYYNQLRGIYYSRYRFFQDFKRTYMLDTSGKCTAYEKKEPKKVIIFITSYGQKGSGTYGMATMNKTSNTGASTAEGEELTLTLPQNNIDIKTDAAFSKEINFSSIYSINMRDASTIGSKVKGIEGYENTVIRRNIYTNPYLNAGESRAASENNIIIRVTLIDIDIDAFTPNKEYVFQFGNPSYADLQGTYRLIKVTTMLERASDEFTMYALSEFRKVPE